MYILGNIGGTKTRIGISKNLKKIDKIFLYSTPKFYKEFLELISKFLHIGKVGNLKASCFGFAGVFDKKKERLIFAPNLKDYENKNLKNDLEKILNCKVYLENDAILEALEEANFGAGKKFKIFGYVTLGTGIGGAKVVNFKIDENYFGFEPGHSLFLIQDKDKIIPIEVEEVLGGKSIERAIGKNPKDIKDEKFWINYSKILALFLINISLLWSIEGIILGGSLTKSVNFKVLKKEFNRFYPFSIKPKILKAKIKKSKGLYGALLFLKDKLS
ncbi:MAG: ROK family protein [Minisyncoccia bacterium]